MEKIVVIGAGPGGYVAAVRAAQSGGQVTVVEKEHPGGTCLNWGCIPSKILRASADVLESARGAGEFGVSISGEVKVDMAGVQKRKERILSTQRKGIRGLLAHNNVTMVSGTASVVEPGLIRVRTLEGEQDLPYDKLILAMGTSPLSIPSFPFDHETVISSNDGLSLDEVPDSVVIVGGGVIGSEFAFILSALGSRVTVVEAMDRILPQPSVDRECSKVIQRCMKKRKIKLLTDRAVLRVDKEDGRALVTVGASPFLDEGGAARVREQQIEADKVLVVVGRQANSRDMGLENLGLVMDERGWIPVDDRMRTNVPGVYAIGDIIGPSRPMLAHSASMEGMVAAENCLGGDRSMSWDCVPGGTFTAPEVGNVGLSEEQAREQGYEVRAETVLLRTLGKAQVLGELDGFVKIVADAVTDRVLGVHIVGAHATDLIAEAGLAVNNGLTVAQVADTIHAHPTLGEGMFEAALKVAGRAVHG